MKSFTFELPSYVDLPPKKASMKPPTIKQLMSKKRKTKASSRVYLSLNSYYNRNHFDRTKIKRKLKLILKEQLKECPIFDKPVKIDFKIYSCSKTLKDKSNFFSVTTKLLYDYLTKDKKWIDDNDDYIKTETLHETEYKKSDNNIIAITITEI